MARFRVYIKPFDTDGNYLSDYVEITSDVAALGNPKRGIDNTEFDVGVFKSSGFNLTLRNDHGRYSEVTELKSIFRYTRKNSLIKITWDIRNYDLICGFFAAGGEPIGYESTVFEGLISEVTSTSDIGAQQATFAVLGFESLLNEMEVPFSSIANGDLLSEILLALLDQAPFNALVTVSSTNINPGYDCVANDVSGFENKTVGAVLKDTLLAANSVLYIKSGTVYVTARDATPTVQKHFYGQASRNVENIINIPKFRDGLNRVFNYWTWKDTTLRSRDTSSIERYDVQAKELELSLIDATATAVIQDILDTNKTEFSGPKIELELETPIAYDVLDLNILDRVDIDYPTIYLSFDGNPLPRYGMETYDGTARYPYEQWSLTLDTSTNFKIMSRVVNISKQTVTFGLREI